MEEEYQKLIHRTTELVNNNPSMDIVLRHFYNAMGEYGRASEQWEKSYNYQQIRVHLQNASDHLAAILDETEGQDQLVVKSFQAIVANTDVGVDIENGLLSSDPMQMAEKCKEGYEISKNTLTQIKDQEAEIFGDLIEYLEDYQIYFDGVGNYARMIYYWNYEPQRFEEEYEAVDVKIQTIIDQLRENESTINLTEIHSMWLNLRRAKEIHDSQYQKLIIKDSEHWLSVSFYIGQTFAQHLHKKFGAEESSGPIEEMFKNKFQVVASGIDELDDFLQTKIGMEFGDNLHFVMEEGTVEVLGQQLTFQPEVLIRKFGTCTVLFHIKINDIDLNVGEIRTIQTLVGPQSGTANIELSENKYDRFSQIIDIIHQGLLGYHEVWDGKKGVLKDFHMTSVEFEPERTWFSRSLLREMGFQDGEKYQLINDYNEIAENPYFNALVLPLYEGRIALEDWIQQNPRSWNNLAEIRFHNGDMIYATKHTMTCFLPENAEFMNQSVISSSSLVNDIATLIIGFDMMAENVRRSLIYYVNDSKVALESTDISKIQENLDRIRKKQIEITEFELLAMQSIQLLKSQESLLYADHSEFLTALIENTDIENVIENLTSKLAMIKESQAGILQTADDLVKKYQEKVAESQAKLIRVISLIVAGFGQIGLIPGIVKNLGLEEPLAGLVTRIVTYFGLGLAGIAIFWMIFGFVKSKSSVFDFSDD